MAGRPKQRADIEWLSVDENLEAFCTAIAELGTQKKALDKFGISPVSLVKFCENHDTAATRVARARSAGASKLAEETIDIADNLDQNELIDPAKSAAMQISTRQWLAARLNRAELGDKVQVDATVSVTNLHLLAVKGRANQVLTHDTPALPAPEPDVIDVEPLPAGLADLL